MAISKEELTLAYVLPDPLVNAEMTRVALSYRLLQNKLDQDEVTDIICEAVEIEREFICESLPVKLIGMNSDMMSEYIDFCADRLLVSLGCSKHYNTTNPFNWMEQISLQYVFSNDSIERACYVPFCIQFVDTLAPHAINR